MSIEISQDRPSLGQLPPPAAPAAPVMPPTVPPAAPAPVPADEPVAWWSAEGQAAWRQAVQADPIQVTPARYPATALRFEPAARPTTSRPTPARAPHGPGYRAVVGGTGTVAGLAVVGAAGWLLPVYGLSAELLAWLLVLLTVAAGAVAGVAAVASNREGSRR